MVEAPAKDKIMVDYMQKARDRVAADEITPLAHIAELLEALDKAESERDAIGAALIELRKWQAPSGQDPDIDAALAKADAAIALIQPEPDPLVQEARNIVANMPGLDALQARAYRDGDWDAGGSVDIALAAIKRGMELARHGLAVKEVG